MTTPSEDVPEGLNPWLEVLFSRPPLTRSQLIDGLVEAALSIHSGSTSDGLKQLLGLTRQLQVDAARDDLVSGDYRIH